MDISAFSETTFDASEWINSLYKQHLSSTTTTSTTANPANTGSNNKDIFVSNMVTKLQLYVQQVNSALEDTSQQVLSNLPKIMKDAQNLENEAVVLRSKMADVQNEIAEVHKETGDCMANLERLDDLKTKLQSAKQGLQESDGWGRLTSELEDLLERNDIIGACNKLQALQKSLIAQQGLAGQSEREANVEGFKNRIEAMASPAVVQCFTNGDIEQSKKYVGIFSNMERLNQLNQYYRTVQKNMLQQQWMEINESLVTTNSSIRFLRDFYEYLYDHCQKQIKWCANVFGVTNATEPIFVIIELLPSLQPLRENAIINALKRHNEKLDLLNEFSSANIFFGNILEKLIRTTTPTPTISIKLTDQQLETLSRSIFDYFNIIILQFPTMEQNVLIGNLNELNLIHSNVGDTVRSLGNANSSVIDWCERSLRHCEDITQNCALPGLVNTLNSVFKTFMDKYRKAQQQLHASRGAEQDWNLLQTCITLLQNIGDFKMQLDELKSKIIDKILLKQNAIETKSIEFGYRIVEKRDQTEFRKLVEIAKNIENNKQHLLVNGAEYGKEYDIFSSVFDVLKPICEYIHDTTLASVFTPIENQLVNIISQDSLNSSVGSIGGNDTSGSSTDGVGGGGDLPDYSFTPQEYITQIGQYLVTLPQHLEPLLLAPSTSLKTALELCDEKYTKNIPSADILLSLLTDECCALYEEKIGQIFNLNGLMSKQLATDIEYFGSVLEELGINLSTHLQQIAVLLRATPETYLSVSSGFNPVLVTAIRQMRNMVSMES